MNGWIDCLIVEARKLKGSLTMLMMVLGPMSVVAFSVLLLFNHGVDRVVEQGWGLFFQGSIAIWAYMVFPLLVALQAATINQIDHAVDGWKRMFSLPVKVSRVFLAKLALLSSVMLASNLVLAAGLVLVAFGCSVLSAALPAPSSSTLMPVLVSLLACAAGGGLMIVVHFLLSWALSSFVIPLTIGVVATMMILQIGSSEYWIWHPWTWALTAAASSDPGRAVQAVTMSLILAVPVAIAGAAMARRLRGVR